MRREPGTVLIDIIKCIRAVFGDMDGHRLHHLFYRFFIETGRFNDTGKSRMKDFYDMWLLSRLFEFEDRTLCEAVRNTFRRRSTALPVALPIAFTGEFRKSTQKHTQ
jgi:hypothetical protein